jgi:chemotaxis protein histidine kinase CheA
LRPLYAGQPQEQLTAGPPVIFAEASTKPQSKKRERAESVCSENDIDAAGSTNAKNAAAKTKNAKKAAELAAKRNAVKEVVKEAAGMPKAADAAAEEVAEEAAKRKADDEPDVAAKANEEREEPARAEEKATKEQEEQALAKPEAENVAEEAAKRKADDEPDVAAKANEEREEQARAEEKANKEHEEQKAAEEKATQEQEEQALAKPEAEKVAEEAAKRKADEAAKRKADEETDFPAEANEAHEEEPAAKRNAEEQEVKKAAAARMGVWWNVSQLEQEEFLEMLRDPQRGDMDPEDAKRFENTHAFMFPFLTIQQLRRMGFSPLHSKAIMLDVACTKEATERGSTSNMGSTSKRPRTGWHAPYTAVPAHTNLMESTSTKVPHHYKIKVSEAAVMALKSANPEAAADGLKRDVARSKDGTIYLRRYA